MVATCLILQIYFVVLQINRGVFCTEAFLQNKIYTRDGSDSKPRMLSDDTIGPREQQISYIP